MSVIRFGSFMLPKKGMDLSKWAVVACDQFTSSPEYWDKVEEYVGESPTTLRLICPEARLSSAEKLLPGISAASESYVNAVLETYNGGVLVKRTLASGDRYGLVCLIDLEEYSYEKSAQSEVRATEGTVIERIPPRLTVRRASRLDVPHVLCLIDDEDCSVIEPLIGKGEVLYDTPLGFGGGRIEGRLVTDTKPLTALDKLQKKAHEKGRPFVLVGDGNHSLASAKALYEEYKAAGDPRAKNARYALVELENLRSNSIVFEPIHRIIYDAPQFAEYLKSYSSGTVKRTMLIGAEEVTFSAPSSEIETYKTVQTALDEFVKANGGDVDYIHGESDLRTLCKDKQAVGVIMPAIAKDEFFDYIAKNGSLPRKTFSMGEAYEKRYYMECRDLKA